MSRPYRPEHETDPRAARDFRIGDRIRFLGWCVATLAALAIAGTYLPGLIPEAAQSFRENATAVLALGGAVAFIGQSIVRMSRGGLG